MSHIESGGEARGSLRKPPEEQVMFFWFLVAVAIVVGLTLLGAFITRRAPGTSWQEHEDRPIGPWGDHY
jgi:hypothetical protein